MEYAINKIINRCINLKIKKIPIKEYLMKVYRCITSNEILNKYQNKAISKKDYSDITHTYIENDFYLNFFHKMLYKIT